MKGDSLARGARSAQFGPAQVSQSKWNEIFGESETKSEVDDKTTNKVMPLPTRREK